MLATAPELLAISPTNLSTEPLAWVRGSDGMVGFGSFAQVEVSGANRFEEARKWWQNQLRQLEIHNNVGGFGTGPILFASFSFDESEPSILTIPEVLVGRRGEKSWITWIGPRAQPELKEHKNESKPLKIQWQGSNGKLWRESVRYILDEISLDKVEKVVLARSIDGTCEQSIDSYRLLSLLHQEFPNTWSFAHRGLIGATPELLVRVSKSLVTSRVLAGTIKRSGDDEKDLSLAASLARSSKDLEEHEYAVRSVGDAISHLCSSINLPESPYVLHLANVMHLATDVTGVLGDSADPADIFDLLTKLHPSAAVCGTPRTAAATVIRKIEPTSRGRYSGAIGWVDIRSDGEFGIALRCGKLEDSGKKIRIYAGCGIVAGSDPDSEYEESEAKLLAMKGALEKH